MPDLDLDDPSQEMMFRMKSMMDDMERKQVKIKVKTAMERLQEQEHSGLAYSIRAIASKKSDTEEREGQTVLLSTGVGNCS